MWLLLLFLFLLLDFFINDHLSFRCSNMCNTPSRLLIFVVLLHFMRYFTKYFFCFYFRNFESVSFLLFIISLVSLVVSHSRLISFRTIPTLQSVHLEQRRLARLYKLLVLIYVSRRRGPSRINLFIAFFVVFVLGDSEEWRRRGIRPVEEIVQVSCGLAFCGNGTPKKENEHTYRRGDVYWNDDILFVFILAGYK